MQIGYFEQEIRVRMMDTTCIEEIWNEFPILGRSGKCEPPWLSCGLTTKHIESRVTGALRWRTGQRCACAS